MKDMGKKLRDLEQHLMAATACMKELRGMKEDTMAEDTDDKGDIGGAEDDDDMASTSLKMRLKKYT